MKYVINILMGIIIVALIYIIFKKNKVIYIREDSIIMLKEQLDRNRVQRDSLVATYEKLIEDHDRRLKLYEKEQQQIVIRYEKRIKELSDVSIVTDDSITKYISNRLHNR